MDVTSAASTTSTTTTKTASSKTGLSSDYQTFLTMLTTQLQNQDPMNPMESSDFAVQLATFSGVEQQVKTNELLTALSTNGALSGMGQYAGWIGMEARVPAAALYDGKALTLTPHAASGADSAKLVVTDGGGKLVSTSTVAVDAETLSWNGTNSDGEALPWGTYSFTLQSFKEGALLSSDPVEVYAKVVETRMASDGTPMLILEGGTEVAGAAATALRPAD